MSFIESLYETIQTRRAEGDAQASYVAKLSAKGLPKIAQKVGEEATETVIEAVSGNREKTIAESADLLFHLCVLWAEMGIAPADIEAELKRREGVSGLEEKEGRK